MNLRRPTCLAILFGMLVGFAGQPFVVVAQTGSANSPPVQLRGDALLAALRGGGYILYFRHTATYGDQNDDRMTEFNDCATQRNLTEAGRAEARAIGTELRDLDIPIGSVLASPYCRTMETAKLLFGRATATPAVRGGPAQPDSPERYAALRELLSKRVAPGNNLAIVSHGNPYRAVVGGAYLGEGEAAVIEPRGAEGFRVVARIPKDAWLEMGCAGAPISPSSDPARTGPCAPRRR
jgi:broad specificity phosphatase PhoE